MFDYSCLSLKKGCCQLQAKVCAQSTGYRLVQACPGKTVVRLTDRGAMAIAVDWDVKQQNKQTNTIATTGWGITCVSPLLAKMLDSVSQLCF